MSGLRVAKLLTKKKVFAAFFVQLNEAYQISVLLPMVVFMCRDFGISSNLLGVYTSFLNASFMFCQFLVSYFWGSFSDKYGRRMALVLGLIFSTISIVIFGLARSYGHAMVARCLCGLFNGNLGVIKAYLSDITDSTNRGFAFSIIAISFGFGNVLGSMMGGLLIETHDVDLPDDEYRATVGIFNFWIFKEDFPFLLPCLFGAFISGNALFWTLYQVKNENQAKLTRMLRSNISNSIISILDVDPMTAKSDIDIFDDAAKSIYQTNNSYSLPILNIEGYDNDNQRKPLLLINIENDKFEETEEIEIKCLSQLLRKTDLIKTLLCYILIAICFMMFREMNPVYMAQALLFNSQFIGYTQAWSGLSLLVFTFWFQPYFLNKYQHRNMGVCNSICLAISIILMPSIYWTLSVDFLNKKWITLSATFLCETLMVIFISILFVVSMCFINNSVPPQHCGKANGLAQSLASLVRAIGPIITGFIWTQSVQYINNAKYAIYWAYLPSFIGFILMAFHMYCFIKPQYQFTWEKQLEIKKK